MSYAERERYIKHIQSTEGTEVKKLVEILTYFKDQDLISSFTYENNEPIVTIEGHIILLTIANNELQMNCDICERHSWCYGLWKYVQEQMIAIQTPNAKSKSYEEMVSIQISKPEDEEEKIPGDKMAFLLQKMQLNQVPLASNIIDFLHQNKILTPTPEEYNTLFQIYHQLKLPQVTIDRTILGTKMQKQSINN